MKHEIFKWCLTLRCNMHSDRRGNGQKAPRTKPSSQKTKPSDKNNWERICTGGFCQVFFTRPTKNREVRDVWPTFGGPGMCDKVWQREGGQNWPKIAWRRPILYGRPLTEDHVLTESIANLCITYNNLGIANKARHIAVNKTLRLFMTWFQTIESGNRFTYM